MSRRDAQKVEKLTGEGAQAWSLECHQGVESVIARFRKELPNWWYSLGECQVSCDASCGPTRHSDDMKHIPVDDRFNSGFHADIPQPSTLAEALLVVLHDALAAKANAEGRPKDAALYEAVSDAIWNSKEKE